MTLDVAPFRRAGLSVSPADFECLVMEAVERVLPDRAPVDARRELTEGELRFLEDAGVERAELAPRDRGAASPLALAAADYAALLATALTVSELAARLGVDESRVRRRLVRHTLYGIKDGKGWRIPLFQLDDAGRAPVPGLQLVVPHWAGAHPVEVARWFTLPHVDLEDAEGQPVAPRAWLLGGGDPRTVVGLAEELRGVA
ncbi:MAG: helix-turn-helix domain-containing protein [Chloroflexi bacterium]|nr:helix-turn-helix domain-containing protein [Chloroflexota bacterium]